MLVNKREYVNIVHMRDERGEEVLSYQQNSFISKETGWTHEEADLVGDGLQPTSN